MDNTYLQQKFAELASLIGANTGKAIREQINALLQTQNIDIQELNYKITTLQNILNSNPSNPNYSSAQSIITQLVGIITRLSALETIVTRLDGNSTLGGASNQVVDYERARAQAAEASIQAFAARTEQALNTHIATYEAIVRNINQNLISIDNKVNANANAIAQENSRATQAEAALLEKVTEVKQELEGQMEDTENLEDNINSINQVLELDNDGNFPVTKPGNDVSNELLYIHDIPGEGHKRANTLYKIVKRLARETLAVDKNLNERLHRIEEDEGEPGSIKTIVKQAVSREANMRSELEADLIEILNQEKIRNQEELAELRNEVVGLRNQLQNNQTTDSNGQPQSQQPSVNNFTDMEIMQLRGFLANMFGGNGQTAQTVMQSHVQNLDSCSLSAAFRGAMNQTIHNGPDCNDMCNQQPYTPPYTPPMQTPPYTPPSQTQGNQNPSCGQEAVII